MSSVSFVVSGLVIRNTRSLHQDTNYVSVAISKNGGVLASQASKVGDQNSGTHAVNVAVTFQGAYLPTDRFVLSYLVMNHGGDDPVMVSRSCQSAMWGLTWNAFNASDAQTVGAWDSTLPSCMAHTERGWHRVDWWNQVQPVFRTLIQQRCDGPVAMDSFSFAGSSIPHIASSASPNQPYTFHYPGIDSPGGCGSNSDYSVRWYATRQ